jgi:hypothetical protein
LYPNVYEPKKTGARCTRALRFVVCVCVSADGSGGGGRAKNISCVNRKYKDDCPVALLHSLWGEEDTTPEEGKVLNVSINFLLNWFSLLRKIWKSTRPEWFKRKKAIVSKCHLHRFNFVPPPIHYWFKGTLPRFLLLTFFSWIISSQALIFPGAPFVIFLKIHPIYS